MRQATIRLTVSVPWKYYLFSHWCYGVASAALSSLSVYSSPFSLYDVHINLFLMEIYIQYFLSPSIDNSLTTHFLHISVNLLEIFLDC